MKITQRMYHFFRKHFLFIALLFFFLLSRYALLRENIIPFAFDHGKDSLSVMRMMLTAKPSLIGPWTSIPGLFFGPAWYYIVMVGYTISSFHPIGAVIILVILHAVSLFIAYKYVDLWSATIMGLAAFWVVISTSAWNPYPMIVTSLLIAIVLLSISNSKRLTWKQALVLGLSASLGFHFSTAYAIFYIPLSVVVMFLSKSKVTIFSLLVFLVGIAIPFVPQSIFEFRNDFVETKAVIGYLQHPPAETSGEQRISHVVMTTFGEIKTALSPEIRLASSQVNKFLSLTTFLLLVYSFFYHKMWKIKEVTQKGKLAALFVLVPLVAYFFLHFNVWYVYGMLPFVVIFIASIVKRSAVVIQVIYALALIMTLSSTVLFFQKSNKYELMEDRGFLPIKEKTIEIVRQKAAGRPFASYHYVPDIYDFSYQYLYYMQAANGQTLPTDFAYSPYKPQYVPFKADLDNHFKELVPQQPPELIFYIVEKPSIESFLDNWWNEQYYSEIIEQIQISDEVTLYIATP